MRVPILVYENPRTHAEEAYNTLAFTDEARGRNNELPIEGSGFKKIDVDSFPRMTECHGWLNFNTGVLFNLDPKVRRKV